MYAVRKIRFKRFHGNRMDCAYWQSWDRSIILRSTLPCRDDPGFDEVQTYIKLLNHEFLHAVLCSLGECRGCNGLDRGWLDKWLGENFGIDCICQFD